MDEKDAQHQDREASMFPELLQHARRAWELLLDDRVPMTQKLIPLGAIAYLLTPVDLVPELFTGPFGMVDDVVLLVMALKLFNRLASEHLAVSEDGAGAHAHHDGSRDAA